MGTRQVSAHGRQRSSTSRLSGRWPLALICVFCGIFLRVPAGATLQGLHVGAAAPDLSLQNLAGQPRTLAELKGEKLTAVVFWSTWSRNSEKALVSLQKLYAKHRRQGLSVIAVNADAQKIPADRVEKIKTLADKLGLEFPVLLDQGLVAFHDYGVIALPSTVVFDPDRTIRYELSGYPLIGSEEMLDFISAEMEGKKPREVASRKGYQPKKTAVRLYNMGKKCLASKRLAPTAELWLKKAAEADPQFVQPRISLGRLYAARDDLALAKEQFGLALEKEPGNAMALCDLGMVLVNEGKLEEGKTLMEKALQSEESYTPCLYYLGYTYGKEGNIKKALAMFNDALALNRMDMDLYVFKGRMLEENDRKAEAADAYRQALELALSLEKKV
jgi:Flp pilus assembly protein TadD/peroxiredoxin